jgi:hypothetical protein
MDALMAKPKNTARWEETTNDIVRASERASSLLWVLVIWITMHLMEFTKC